MDGHFDDITVRAVLRHLNPVSYPDHAQIEELNAGHKSENGVLENEQKDGGQSAQNA